MTHHRNRHLKNLLLRGLKFSPIIGLFGHRQVGKTTLASSIGNHYATLDVNSVLDKANFDPFSFIASSDAYPFVIDECQLSPALFPALKEHVRLNKKPGQFILTGSVRFSSRKAIRESLTGRMIAWELLPMDLSETYHQSLPMTLPRLLKSKNVEVNLPRSEYFSEKAYQLYIKNGGLPGVFSIRDNGVQHQRFETQLNTILERDLKLIVQTTLSYRQLRQFAVLLATKNGQPLEYSSLSRDTRISVPTLKKLISAFESIFLIRVLESEGTQKKPIIYFEDLGEANFLADLSRNELQTMNGFLFANLRTQLHYRPELKATVFQYRNRGGGLVPLCFKNQEGVIGFIPSLEETPSESALGSARSFLKSYRNAKIFIVHRGKSDRIISNQIRILSAGQLL